MRKIFYLIFIFVLFISFNDVVKANCIYEKDGKEYSFIIDQNTHEAYLDNENVPISKTNFNYIVGEEKCYNVIFRCNKSWGFDDSDSEVYGYCSNAIIYKLKGEKNEEKSIPLKNIVKISGAVISLILFFGLYKRK